MKNFYNLSGIAMIMVGKVFIALIWTFWLFASGSVADGQNVSPEYIPTYSSTYDRVIKRGYVICGTNDEFPGFSQEHWSNEDGKVWKGFDVDICRAVAIAMFGSAENIEFEVVNLSLIHI